MKNISLNKVFAMTRLAFVNKTMTLTNAIWFAVPLIFVLVAYIMEDEMSEVIESYLTMSMIMTCNILVFVFINYFKENGIMRKMTLPVTLQEKFTSILLSMAAVSVICLLYCMLAGTIMFVMIGHICFDTDMMPVILSSFVRFFTGSRSIMYLFLIFWILLLSSGFSVSKKKSRRTAKALISLMILFIAFVMVARLVHQVYIIIAYDVFAITACLIGTYNNVKYTQSY